MNLYLRMIAMFLTRRRRKPLDLWDVARIDFRVSPSDLDVLGHMNNGKYLTLMDLGRVDWLTRAGFWAKLKTRGWYPVVASQTVTYRRSLEPGQRFELCTRMLGFYEGSSFVEQTFVRDSRVYAQAIVRARFRKRSGGRVEMHEIEELAGGTPEGLQVPSWVQQWADSTTILPDTFEAGSV